MILAVRAWLLPALLAVSVGAPVSVAVSSVPKPRELPGKEAELKTQDGWTLKAKYWAARPGQATFVLLHGKGRGKESWIRLARGLSRAGYGYLGVDLRGHGQSAAGPDGKPVSWRKFKATKTENAFADMSWDVQAAFAYLAGQGVAEETIGLIGADVGGSLALKYAAVHPKVPMVVLLSPGMNYQEILTVNAARAYKDRPILMVYSELDKKSSKEAPVLYEFARRSAGERNATVISVPGLHGHRMLNNALVRRIVDWIKSPLKPETAVSTGTALSGVATSTGAAEDLGPEEPSSPGDSGESEE